jgi:hypothetical protein
MYVPSYVRMYMFMQRKIYLCDTIFDKKTQYLYAFTFTWIPIWIIILNLASMIAE